MILQFIGLYTVKYYSSIDRNNCILGISMLCYAAIPYLLYLLISKGTKLGTANLCINIVSIMSGLFIAIILLGENINSLKMYSAILTVLAALLFFYKKNKN